MLNGRMKVRPTQLGCNGLSTAVELTMYKSNRFAGAASCTEYNWILKLMDVHSLRIYFVDFLFDIIVLNISARYANIH